MSRDTSDSRYHGPGRIKSTLTGAAFGADVGVVTGLGTAAVSIGRNETLHKLVGAINEAHRLEPDLPPVRIVQMVQHELQKRPEIVEDFRKGLARAGALGLVGAVVPTVAMAVEGYHSAAKGRRQFADMVEKRDQAAANAVRLEQAAYLSSGPSRG